jgi:hypothetical protein
VTTSANGPAHKRSLADQIDRLDGILDGLAEGLNQAVAQAVQDAVGVAVREAVRSVLAELLTNPDVLTLVRAAAAPPSAAGAEPEAGRPFPVAGGLGRAWAWVGDRVRQARRAAALMLRRARRALAGGRALLGYARRHWVRLSAALAVGAAAGAAAYWAGPWFAAGAAGLGGFVSALAAQAAAALRRLAAAAAPRGA